MHFDDMRTIVNHFTILPDIRLIFLVFVLAGLSLTACKTPANQATRQQKAIAQKKEAQRKQSAARYQSKMERHERMQSEEGRNRIKQAREQSSRLDKRSGQRKFFLSRWFSKKEPACP